MIIIYIFIYIVFIYTFFYLHIFEKHNSVHSYLIQDHFIHTSFKIHSDISVGWSQETKSKKLGIQKISQNPT